jgi:hypothetical protein
MADAACDAAKSEIATKAPLRDGWRMKASSEAAIVYFCFACSGEA